VKIYRTLPEELGISEFKVIEGDEALKIAHHWLSIYCPKRTSFKGILGGKTYLWDEIHSDTQDELATQMYSENLAPSYFLMEDNFGQVLKQIFVTSIKPIENKYLMDFHVFPKNFAWSMAFTHEDGWIGPKFFKHVQYEQLQKQNNKAVTAKARRYPL
jgi:hypothetical protein